jgi:hypothetical protein
MGKAMGRDGVDCSRSEFGRRADILSAAELVADEHIGGPTGAMSATVEEAETALHGVAPVTTADFRFLALRLARAVENDWTARAAAPLAAAAKAG